MVVAVLSDGSGSVENALMSESGAASATIGSVARFSIGGIGMGMLGSRLTGTAGVDGCEREVGGRGGIGIGDDGGDRVLRDTLGRVGEDVGGGRGVARDVRDVGAVDRKLLAAGDGVVAGDDGAIGTDGDGADLAVGEAGLHHLVAADGSDVGRGRLVGRDQGLAGGSVVDAVELVEHGRAGEREVAAGGRRIGRDLDRRGVGGEHRDGAVATAHAEDPVEAKAGGEQQRAGDGHADVLAHAVARRPARTRAARRSARRGDRGRTNR